MNSFLHVRHSVNYYIFIVLHNKVILMQNHAEVNNIIIVPINAEAISIAYLPTFVGMGLYIIACV